MTDTFYDITDPLFVELLNIACSDPSYVELGGNPFSKEVEEVYSTYRVETHLLAVTYTARPIERDGGGWPTRYVVIKRDYEAC